MLKVLVSLLMISSAWATEELSPDVRDGYLWTVNNESRETAGDLILMAPPSENSVALKDQIFNQELTLEFKERYRQKFGYTEAESTFWNQPTLGTFWSSTEARLLDGQERAARQKEFGEYLFRRLAEHHVDKYFKNDPQLRHVYELKERLSHVEVQVADSVRMKTNYNYASNELSFIVDNPIAQVQLRLEMNQSSVGPSEVQETVLQLSRQMTTDWRSECYYKTTEASFSFVNLKAISESTSVSLSATSDWSDSGKHPKDNYALAGLSVFY